MDKTKEEKGCELLAELSLPRKNDRTARQNLGLATFSIEDAVLEEALNRRVTVLQRRGDLIETIPATA